MPLGINTSIKFVYVQIEYQDSGKLATIGNLAIKE